MLAGARQQQPVFPWWYPFVKWALPLGAALIFGLWVGLILTGMIATPSILASIGIGSVLGSMEGFAAMTLITLTVGTVASMVGLMTSMVVRGAILFNPLEVNLTVLDLRNADLENRLSSVNIELRDLKAAQEQERRQLFEAHAGLQNELGFLQARDEQLRRMVEPNLPTSTAPSALVINRSAANEEPSISASPAVSPNTAIPPGNDNHRNSIRGGRGRGGRF